MLSTFQDFGFVEWWKAVAVVLTGAFAFLALTRENKDKRTGKLTVWGRVLIAGIAISSMGGLLAQIVESSEQATAEKRRHREVVTMLTDQARLLRPLKIDKVYGEFNVPCEAAYLNFCNAVRAFHNANPFGIAPIALFDTFPGGRTQIINLSLRFFANEDEAKAQLRATDDEKSKYSAYMQLPLISGNEYKCGMRVFVAAPTNDVRLTIIQSCPFMAVNNNGGLQSHLDLNGLEFSTQVGPLIVGVPPLEPVQIKIIYADAEQDTVTNLARVQDNNATIYVTKFIGKSMPSIPSGTP
jgi:hypothetical protein